MDKHHRPLPRFADIQGQPWVDNPQEDESTRSERYHGTRRRSNISDPNPPALHPPMQTHHPIRPDGMHQLSTKPPAHSEVQSQPFYNRRAETNIPTPRPSTSQPIPGRSAFDTDRIVHSQSPPTDALGITMSSGHLSLHERQQQTSVAEGGITKPKKLHREVEQKRRMRMAEQIVELKKWVSNPNSGKSDKVSVLQDAVSFVKESSRKIDELQEALDRSREECAHLRSLLNNFQAPALPGPPARPTPSLTRLSPVQQLVGSLQHSANTTTEEIRHHSRFAVAPINIEERKVGTGLPTSANHSVLGAPLPLTNYSPTVPRSVTGRAGPSLSLESVSHGDRTDAAQARSVSLMLDLGRPISKSLHPTVQLHLPQASAGTLLQARPIVLPSYHHDAKQNPTQMSIPASGRVQSTTERERLEGGSTAGTCEREGQGSDAERSESRG